MQDNYTVLHVTDLRRSLDRNVGQFYILDVHVYFNIYGVKIPKIPYQQYPLAFTSIYLAFDFYISGILYLLCHMDNNERVIELN